MKKGMAALAAGFVGTLAAGCFFSPRIATPNPSPSSVDLGAFDVRIVPESDQYHRTVELRFDGFPIQGKNGSVIKPDGFHVESGTSRIRQAISTRGWTGEHTYRFTLTFEPKPLRFGFDIVSDFDNRPAAGGIILNSAKARLGSGTGPQDWIGVGDWSGDGKEEYFMLELK